MKARLQIVFVAGLVVRLAVAAVTEWKPLFPKYYYADAALSDALAARVVAGSAPSPAEASSISQRTHAYALAAVYHVFGRRPLIGKLAHCVVSTAGLAAMLAALEAAFGSAPAMLAAMTSVVWPSAAFFGSQNFKDPFLLAGIWLLFSAAWLRRPSRWLAGATGAFLLAVFRPYLLGIVLISVAIGRVSEAVGPRKTAALGVLALALAAAAAACLPPLHGPFVRDLVSHGDPRYAGVDPLTPGGIAQVRRLRQESDRIYGRSVGHERIGTQLFPDERLGTWGELAAFIPRSAFYVLFMPLPGLYPLERNLGRCLASFENILLLLLSIVAVARVGQRSLDGPRVSLLVFFCVMAGVSALIDFDLGGAVRHKFTYLPALLVFAFA